MGLRDVIRKDPELDEDMVQNAVDTYEKNMYQYKGKSMTWIIRITADELGMKKDDLCEVLDDYYTEHGDGGEDC
jgi:hypothetical protein